MSQLRRLPTTCNYMALDIDSVSLLVSIPGSKCVFAQQRG